MYGDIAIGNSVNKFNIDSRSLPKSISFRRFFKYPDSILDLETSYFTLIYWLTYFETYRRACTHKWSLILSFLFLSKNILRTDYETLARRWVGKY